MFQELRTSTNALYWAPLCAASLHIFEEFVFPGHFAEWYRRFRPAIRNSITPRFLVIINGLLLVLCYDVGVLRGSSWGVYLWLLTMAMLAANGVWHLQSTIKSASYSPGVITGVLVYIPLAVFGFLTFERSGQINLSSVGAILIGGSYHWWSLLFHRSRTKAKAARDVT